MKLTKLIEKLQEMKEYLEIECSAHKQELWDDVSFVVETKKDGYETGDYKFLCDKKIDYDCGNLLGCRCPAGLTVILQYEKDS